MTDGQWLFTVFAVLYLIECMRLLPGTAFVLTGAGKRWRLRRPYGQVQIAKARLLLLPLLPPTQAHLTTQPWLFAPCEDGVELCDPEERATAPALIPWPDLALTVEGPLLTLTKDRQIRVIDEASARAWKDRLLAWMKLKQPAREADFLKLARHSLSRKSLAAQATQLSDSTRWPSWLALMIIVWTFVVITGIYRWKGEHLMLYRALAELVALMWMQAVIFFRTAGRAGQPVQHRFWKALGIAFLPQQAMRATDAICRAQICTAHPLAARGLLSEAAWKKLAAREWKNLRHGQAKSAALQMRALEAYFRQQEITPEDLEELPVRHPGSAAYCPNCLAQFTDPTALCQECGGVVLKAWPEEKGAEAEAAQ